MVQCESNRLVIMSVRQVQDVYLFEARRPIIAKIICTYIDTFLCVRKTVFAIIGLNGQVRPFSYITLACVDSQLWLGG